MTGGIQKVLAKGDGVWLHWKSAVGQALWAIRVRVSPIKVRARLGVSGSDFRLHIVVLGFLPPLLDDFLHRVADYLADGLGVGVAAVSEDLVTGEV